MTIPERPDSSDSLRDQADRLSSERQQFEDERQALIHEARENRETGYLAASFELIDAAHRIDPADVEAAQLRAQILADIREVVRRGPSNPVLSQLLERHDGPSTRRRAVQAAGVAAGLLLVVIAWILLRDTGPTTAGTPKNASPPGGTSSPATTATKGPEQAKSDVRSVNVTIDLRPWARVSITPLDPSGTRIGDTQETPFTVALTPGAYTLRAVNDLTPALDDWRIVVKPGESQEFSRDMPGFNASQVVELLLGSER